MSVKQESKFTSDIRRFLEGFNARVCRRVEVGATWVRLRPPTIDEAGDARTDARCLRFMRVGSLATVQDACDRYVTLRCGAESMTYDRAELLATWTRAVAGQEWD